MTLAESRDADASPLVNGALDPGAPETRAHCQTAPPLCESAAPHPGRSIASAPIPTEHGAFEAHVFRGVSTVAGDVGEHVVLVKGQLRGLRGVPLRVHSECMTSEVFGSLKCDCADQLALAQKHIAEVGCGLVVYLRQEGRGIGLAAKLRAYALQAEGADTVDANRQLGLPDDARCYDTVAAVLDWFGVKSVRLMTNNPEKVQALRRLGVTVDAVIPSLTGSNPHSAPYLNAKRARMGHWLPTSGGVPPHRPAPEPLPSED